MPAGFNISASIDPLDFTIIRSTTCVAIETGGRSQLLGPLFGTFETRRAGPMMSVDRGRPEVVGAQVETTHLDRRYLRSYPVSRSSMVQKKKVVSQFEIGGSEFAHFGRPQWTHFLANGLRYQVAKNHL